MFERPLTSSKVFTRALSFAALAAGLAIAVNVPDTAFGQGMSLEESARFFVQRLGDPSEKNRGSALDALRDKRFDFVTQALAEHLLSGRETNPKNIKLLVSALCDQFRPKSLTLAQLQLFLEPPDPLYVPLLPCPVVAPDGDDYLLDLTQSTDDGIRTAALSALSSYLPHSGLNSNQRAIDIMIATLEERDGMNSYLAAKFLANAPLDRSGVLDALLTAMAERDQFDPDPSVTIAYKIKRSQDPRVLEALLGIAASSADDKPPVGPIIGILGDYDVQQARDALIALLPAYPREVSAALSKKRDPSAIPALVAQLPEIDGNDAVATALHGPFKWVPSSDTEWVYLQIGLKNRALLRENWDKTLAVLRKDIDGDLDRKAFAAIALIMIRDEKSLAVLDNLLNEKRGSRRVAEICLNSGWQSAVTLGVRWATERGLTILPY